VNDRRFPEDLPALPPRGEDAHKGAMGRVIILGGSTGLSGAVVLAARAALRSGAGLVVAAVPRSIQAVVAAGCIEATSITLPDDAEGTLVPAALPRLAPELERATALVLGPGLGRAAATGELVALVLERFAGPHVVDADGLWHLARDGKGLAAGSPARVLTPHEGEFARLREALALPAADPGSEVRAFAHAVPGVLLRKGPQSRIAEGERIARNPTGGPALATAGTGDVLSGIIGALLGRGDPPFVAARRGAWLHGRAGDLARDRLGAESVIASDLIDELPVAFREMERAVGGR